MTSSDIFQNISIIVIILGGISGIVWTYLKGRKELRRQDIDSNAGAIDSSRDALEIVTLSTKQVLELKREIMDAEVRMKQDREALTVAYNKQIKDLQEEVIQLKTQVSEMQAHLTAEREWSERLCFQIKSLGGEPIPLKLDKTKK